MTLTRRWSAQTAYISGALAAMLDLGHGSGPMNHMFALKGDFCRMKKTSTFQNGLIWFGAGVSLAEILTGTAFAPLGMAKGFAAILLGHIIGCAMMLLAGLIGGRTGRSAMETVKMSFGQKGGLLFAFLNVLQLVGWTAIMIYDGALAVGGIFAIGRWVWCLVIGALIIVWIAVGVTDLGWINKLRWLLCYSDAGAVQGHLLLRQRHGRH